MVAGIHWQRPKQNILQPKTMNRRGMAVTHTLTCQSVSLLEHKAGIGAFGLLIKIIVAVRKWFPASHTE